MEQGLWELADMLGSYGEKIELLPSPKEAIEAAMSGNFEFSFKGFLLGVIKALFTALSDNALPLGAIVAVAFACALCMTAADCDLPPWSDSLMIAMGIALAVPCAAAFTEVISSARQFFTDLETLNLGIVPALTTVAVPVQSGVFLLAAQILGQLMKTVFLPGAIIYGVLGFSGSFHDRFGLRKVGEAVKSCYNWGLGLVMLVFSAVTAGAGIVSGASVSLAVKTVKYTAGSAVPVVGRYLSESADLVASGAALVKSAAGVGCCVALVGVCLAPFLKMFAFVLLFKLAAIIIKPVLDGRLCTIVDTVGEAVSMIMGAVALMCIFSFMSIAIIVGAGVSGL